MWTLIRLLLKEQSDLGPHCLQKSQADDKADDNLCDWQFKGLRRSFIRSEAKLKLTKLPPLKVYQFLLVYDMGTKDLVPYANS